MNKPQPQPIQKLQKKSSNEQLSTSRKRSYSTSSTDYPSAMFSNYSSDSTFSTMNSSNEQLNKKRSINNQGSSSSGESFQVSSSGSSFSSNQTPQRLSAQRSVPAFLNKLFTMVNSETTNGLVRWSNNGKSFIVEDHDRFAEEVLPTFYKHKKFTSFVRQLNMYDFHKIPHIQQGVLVAENVHEIWEFSNPNFRRGREELLILVTRKKNKDKDIMDGDSPTISSLADDLSTVKTHQATVREQLNILQRDNEIIWHETLNSRDKYHRHQEAIEKILLFLTAVFSTDQLTLSNNSNSNILPKTLIEEAANLADITINEEEVNRIKSSNYALGPGALTDVLSSVLRLYSEDSHKDMGKEPVYPSATDESNIPSLTDFSKTINTATRSANSIAQDIDILQMNIESLANNLGIDPNQCDDELDMDNFQTNYNMWSNPKMYSMADPISQSTIANEKSQQQNIADIINSSQVNFPIQNTFTQQSQPLFQRRKNKAKSLDKPTLPIETNSAQPQINLTPNNNHHQFITPDNDSFGPNYPSGDLSAYEQAIALQSRKSTSTNLFSNGTGEMVDMKENYNFPDLQNNYVSNIPGSPFYKKR